MYFVGLHDFLYRVDPDTGLNMNEMFRAVHDYFGHGVRGNKFDALGEEMAYARTLKCTLLLLGLLFTLKHEAKIVS